MNELQAKYAAQTDTVVDLQSQVSALEERLAQLEASLKKKYIRLIAVVCYFIMQYGYFTLRSTSILVCSIALNCSC